MSQSVRAVFENGVFRPLEPVALSEQQPVRLDVMPLSVTEDPAPVTPKPAAPNALQLANQLGLIPCADVDEERL